MKTYNRRKLLTCLPLQKSKKPALAFARRSGKLCPVRGNPARENKNQNETQRYQHLQKIANNRTGDYTRAEKMAAEKQLAAAEISGTVFVPVYFGAGAAKGEAAEVLAARRSIATRHAKAVIRQSRVSDIDTEAYRDFDVAHVVAQDSVGMGSCTTARVSEADPEAAADCDISCSKGRGWRLA